ncbi:hypothetical protein ACFU44_31260 [Nocardia rhizosphaerihabitans]|uniref:baeRF11 domain-containing protein n=1 Tax=Nocardia rhizosphaerihabitans TaxID=1691570 RepID=UPI003672321B
MVLALSEGAARLVHVDAEGPAVDITPRDLPTSASDHAKKASLGDRAPKGRVQGYEGRKMRVRQYARAVDQHLRIALTGRDVPLVPAATEPTDSLFRSVNSYPDLLDVSLAGNPEHLGLDELAAYAGQLSDLRTLFDKRMSEGRALADIADIARAATFGIVGTLFVDIETAIPGTLAADDRAVEFGSDAEGLDVLDEIARRVLLTDGRVLAVRGPEVPGGGAAAAILRYQM